MTSGLRALLAAQDGVVTLGQAATAGLDRSAVQRRVVAGEWKRVGRGVYFVADRAMSTEARMRIACLSSGPKAVLSSTSAAWWHGLLDTEPRSIAVTVPRGRHGTPPRGIQVVHRDLADCDVVERRHLLVTGAPLTVVEAAASAGSQILDSALLRGRVSLEQLRAAHARYPGRRGAGITARQLRGAESGARSEAERLLHRILRSARITGWTANHPTCGYVVDAAFTVEMVAVEIDGYAFHSGADAFQHDRTRHNALVAGGWTVLHFTWQDLTERPRDVVAQICAALGQR